LALAAHGPSTAAPTDAQPPGTQGSDAICALKLYCPQVIVIVMSPQV
jgi:hypothetical protein